MTARRLLNWAQVKQQIDEAVTDTETVGLIEYNGEPYITTTLNARTKEVEIYGSFESPESREG